VLPSLFLALVFHKEEEALKPTKTHHPSNLKPSFNPKRGVKKYHDEFIFFASLFFLCSVSFYVGDVWRHGEQVIDGVRLLKTHDR
jgi:hypothetical protein